MLPALIAFTTLGCAAAAGFGVTINPFGSSGSFGTLGSSTRPNYMMTPDSFAPGGGGLYGGTHRSTGRLPAETRLAWLEYLANAYVQCDDFEHARRIISEMYYWLVELPRLRRNISIAVQVIQRRIDERHECFMRNVGPNACHFVEAEASPAKPKTTSSDLASPSVVEKIEDPAKEPLTRQEKQQIRTINRLLSLGHVNAAMEAFQQAMLTSKATVVKDPFGQLEFVLKLIRFDLENPDNCIPLWRTTCCLNWKMKHRILDAYDLMHGRTCPRHTGSRRRSLRRILRRIDNMPLSEEIKTRLLVASGRPEAWPRLRMMRLSDRYLAKACLALKSTLRPDSPSEIVPGRPASWTALPDQLEARSKARALYQRCIYDRRLPLTATTRCQEGLSEIQGLEKSCPYGGFIRIGLFSQIFGDYLFIKCLSLPYSYPASMPLLPNFRGTLRQSRRRTISHAPDEDLDDKPIPSKSYLRLVGNLSRLMASFKENIRKLEPLDRQKKERLWRYTPRHRRHTERWLRLQEMMNEKIEDWDEKLRKYMRHLRLSKLQDAQEKALASGVTGTPTGQKATPTREALAKMTDALSQLAADMERK